MFESSSSISEHCWQLWNNQYTASNKATHYKLLFPHVARTLQYPLPPKIFRLCTGHCQLNGHLHKLGLHLDGRCDTCGTSETVEHHLIHCSKFNRQRTAFTSNIRALQINFNWITILRTPTVQRYILSYLKQTGKPVCWTFTYSVLALHSPRAAKRHKKQKQSFIHSLFAVLELSGRCAAWCRSNRDLAVSGTELSYQRISLTCVYLFCLLYLLRHLCGCQG